MKGNVSETREVLTALIAEEDILQTMLDDLEELEKRYKRATKQLDWIPPWPAKLTERQRRVGDKLDEVTGALERSPSANARRLGAYCQKLRSELLATPNETTYRAALSIDSGEGDIRYRAIAELNSAVRTGKLETVGQIADVVATVVGVVPGVNVTISLIAALTSLVRQYQGMQSDIKSIKDAIGITLSIILIQELIDKLKSGHSESLEEAIDRNTVENFFKGVARSLTNLENKTAAAERLAKECGFL